LPEEAEIEALIGKAKIRLDAAYHLLGKCFYEDAEKFLVRIKEAIKEIQNNIEL
jgi:hypothetical protein